MIRLLVVLALALALEAGAQTFPAPGPGHLPWTAGGGGGGDWAATWGACTAGTNCYCDRVKGTGPLGTGDPLYQSTNVFCEDFDHDAFWATTPTDPADAFGNGNWVSTSGALFGSGDRGGGSRWARKYRDTTGGLTWQDGQPSCPGCPHLGPVTAVGGSGISSGPREYDAADRWDSSGYSTWIDIIHNPSEFAAENGSTIPTIPGTGGASIMGDNLLAHRNGVSGTGGFHSELGTMGLGNRAQFGFATLIGFESTINASNILLNAWKFDEVSGRGDPDANDGLMGFRQFGVAPQATFPLHGFMFTPTFSCATALAGVTVTAGAISCDGGDNIIWHATTGGARPFSFASNFDLASHHCLRTYWDFRTISSVSMYMELDGVKYVEISGINLTGSYYDGAGGTNGWDGFRMDNYANRAADSPIGAGSLAVSTRRYADNFTIADGQPQSCSKTGFPLLP